MELWELGTQGTPVLSSICLGLNIVSNNAHSAIYRDGKIKGNDKESKNKRKQIKAKRIKIK